MCNKNDTLGILSNILFYCSILSGFFCSITILLYFLLKNQRTTLFRVILFMSFADVLRSLDFLLGPYVEINKTYCKIFGFMGNFTITFNAIWSYYIVFLLYQIYNKFPKQAKDYLGIWCIFAFIVAPIFQALPLITDSYGRNEGSCTYKRDTNGYIWRSVQEFTLFLGIIISLGFYMRIYLKLKKLKIMILREIVFEKGMIYSIITFTTLAILICYRYFEINKHFCDIWILALLSYCFFSLNGVFNFIALLFNKEFRAGVYGLLRNKVSRHDSDYYIINAICN